MVQRSSGPGFDLEALELARVHRRSRRQHLECHPALERILVALVNHTHPTPAHLTQQAIVAEATQLAYQITARGGLVMHRASHASHHRERWKHPAQRIGSFRIPMRELFPVDALAVANPDGELGRPFDQKRIVLLKFVPALGLRKRAHRSNSPISHDSMTFLSRSIARKCLTLAAFSLIWSAAAISPKASSSR